MPPIHTKTRRPLTNLVQTLLMMVLPASIVLCFGEMIGNRRQGCVLYGVMGALLLVFLPVTIASEQAGTPRAGKRRNRNDANSRSAGRQHGRQGSPLRHRSKRTVRDRHDRVHHGKREFDA